LFFHESISYGDQLVARAEFEGSNVSLTAAIITLNAQVTALTTQVNNNANNNVNVNNNRNNRNRGVVRGNVQIIDDSSSEEKTRRFIFKFL
jgi:hypothetical protein